MNIMSGVSQTLPKPEIFIASRFHLPIRGVAQCTIAVAGFQNEQEVAVASYTFSPLGGDLSVPLIPADMPAEFVALQNVTVIQNDPTADTLTADDFMVTTYT